MTKLDPLPDWVMTRRQVIGGRLRDARMHANLTQLRLGERVGLDHKTISRIEHGQSDPTLSDLLLMAAALQIRLGDLDA